MASHEKTTHRHRSLREAIADFFDPSSSKNSRRQSSGRTGSNRNLPPRYEDVVALHPPAKNKSHNKSSKPRSNNIDTSQMDPIVLAAYQNQTESPLVGLSDALLIAIMERLDLVDILRLRHVSRDFMRLFSQSPIFQKHHLNQTLDQSKYTKLALIWATPIESYPNQYRRYRSLCQACSEFREKKGYADDKELLKDVPFLYCAGCNMEHRAFYFSAQQRHEENDSERLCVGRTSRTMLCPHISITWDSMQRLADRPPGHNVVECEECRPRDSKTHHKKDPRAPVSCLEDYKPQFKAYRDQEQRICFEMLTTVPIPFVPAESGKVKSLALRKDLDRLVTKRFCSAPYIWMPIHAYTWNKMSLFDPNLCSCLDWGLPDMSSSSVHGKDFNWRLCPTSQKPRRHRPPLGSSSFTGADEFRCERGDRCAGFAHDSHKSVRHGITFDVKLIKCAQDERLLLFQQIAKSRAVSPLDLGWFVFIPEGRFGLYDDEAMTHVAYCPDLDCRTRSLASKVLR